MTEIYYCGNDWDTCRQYEILAYYEQVAVV